MLDIAAYVVYGSIMAYAAVIDWRTLHIPNKLVIAIMLDWLIWQITRDILPRLLQHSGWADMLFALGPADASAANGVLAAVVFGAGLMLFTLAYEALTHKYSMGGGDVKLMAASALFLGLQRSLIALMIACVAAVLVAVLYRKRREHTSERECESGCAHAHISRETYADGIPFGPAIAAGSFIALFL